MEDVRIMENMKEVLKKTRKSKHRKSRSHQSVERSETNGDDAISEILSKKWMFSSPPSARLMQTEQEVSTKLNAFEMMMSKKPEPLVQISPEVNGIKKKRKYTKKPKYNKLEDEPDNKSEELHHDENTEAQGTTDSSANGMLRFLNKNSMLPENVPSEEKSVEKSKKTPKRKRHLTNDTPEDAPVIDNKSKKRKTKVDKMLLDSNENSLETPLKVIPEPEVETPTYQSGRPRRSCAGKISYEALLSPDKAKLPENSEATTQRSTRSNTTKQADNSFDTLVVDDDSPLRNRLPKKLAPVFVKKVPKPAIDPAVKEARRNFLLLGLPEDMRNSIDKQNQFEDEILSNELIAFPSISHVTQLKSEDDNDVITERLWQKSLVKIKAIETEPKEGIQQRLLTRGALTDCCPNDTVPVFREFCPVERQSIDDVSKLVKQMKEDFGNFPTNRCYKQLYWKHKNAKTEETDSDYMSEVDCAINEDNSLFVDIFKPNKFDEFLVSVKPIQELRKFLLTWNDKEKSDEYDSDDSSSWQSKGLNNYAVLTGLNGSGKTSSIYALANDLNYQVIEINAGSRRSGKKMLQDLSEATQSHRVRNKSGKLLSTQEEASSQGFSSDASNGAKSIILIEDAELVFESDEGFAASIQQLINISKRPVILTTNNRNCQHLQKFIQHNEIMYQRPKNVNHIAKYLSLLCLAANYQINAVATEHLYALNGHDLRKTINEIEFFIRSESATATDGNLMKFYERPRREWLRKGRLNYSNKTLSFVCFESSIISSFAAAAKRADDNEDCYQQHHLTDEMAEFFAERCNVVEIQPDLAHGKQKIIER